MNGRLEDAEALQVLVGDIQEHEPLSESGVGATRQQDKLLLT